MTDALLEQIDRQELRNRSMLICKVHTFWIENVLQKSFEPGGKFTQNWQMRPDLISEPKNYKVSRTGLPEKHVEIASLFNRSGQKLLILGESGAGKTTCLLELALDLLELAKQDVDQPIPVVLYLSTWKESFISFERWLVEELRLKYQIPEQISQSWLDENRLTLLLDGLDELRPNERPGCVKAINRFLRNHECGITVCCQNEEYLQLEERLMFEEAIQILPPGDGQVAAFFQRQPSKKSLDEYIQSIFARQKGNLRYAPEQLIGWLSWLARSMSQHGKTIFLIEDLQADWLPPGKAQDQYRKNVSWAILIPIVACFVIGGLGFISTTIVVDETLVQYTFLFLWLAAGVYGVYTSADLVRIRPVDLLHWNWPQLGKFIIICLAFSNFMFFFPLLAILNGFSKEKFDSNHAPNQRIRHAVWLALAATLISLLFFVLPLIGGLSLILLSMEGRIAFGPVFLASLPFILLPALGTILALGGKTVLQHTILRLLLVSNQRLPTDLSGFFNDVVNCGFLVSVGNGYIFKHRLLMDHFASLDKTASEEALDCIENGESYRDEGDYEQAISLYSKALEIPAWEQAGEFKRQDIQTARTDCSIELSQSLIEEDEASDAVAVLETTAVWNEVPQEKIQQLLKEAKEKRATNYLQEAQQREKIWQALHFYNKALEYTAWPGVEQAWLERAIYLLEMHRYQACIEDCDQALAEGADEGQVRAIRGEAYYNLNEFQAAAEDLSKAVMLDTGGDWEIALCGNALRYLGQTSEAVEKLNEAIGMAPKDELYLEWRGLAHLASDSKKAALDDFEQLWEMCESFNKAYASYLCGLASRANRDQSQSYLQDAIEQAEKLHNQWYHWENAFNLALYCLADNDLESATELYQDILDNQPPSFQVYKAMRRLEDFRQIVPDHPHVHLFLAQLREYMEVEHEDHRPSFTPG